MPKQDQCLRDAISQVLRKLSIGVSTISFVCAAQSGFAQETVNNSTASDAVDSAAVDGMELLEEVVVSGIRRSLSTAQDLKRDSDTVIDAITAEDIGALPDMSVNEALQRVPGVAITRFAAASDTQHFSVEGSGVVIRGLDYVQSQFNGRDTFSADGGRAISFNDVAPELVGSVEVFKNLTADMVEGGISGIVNLNTRKPLDQDGQVIYLSVDSNYGDFSEKASPSVTGLYSNSWDLESGGRVGFLASATSSQLKSRSDSVFVTSVLPRPISDTDTFPVPEGFDRVYAPLGAGVRSQDFDRKRTGYAAAAQFESADQRLLATAQFLRTDGHNAWVEHTTEAAVWYQDVDRTFPAEGTDYTYDENGVFTSGAIRYPDWYHWDNSIGGFNEAFQKNGIPTRFSNRGVVTDSVTDDFSINVKYEVNDRLRTNFDLQYVKSTSKNTDISIETYTYSDMDLDLTGDIAQLDFSQGEFASGETVTSEEYMTDPNSLYFGNAMTNRADNDGEEWAFRIDAEYDLSDDGFFRRARVGLRYADRDQTVRTNDYNNWGAVSQLWTSGGPQTFADIDPSLYEVYSYTNFFRGDSHLPPSANFLRGNVAEEYDTYQQLMRELTAAGGGGYTPLEDRDCVTTKGFFCDNEIYRNTETTDAAYVRIDFAIDELGDGMSFDGNVGLRYVSTETNSYGSSTFPNLDAIKGGYDTVEEYCAAALSDPNPTSSPNAICSLGAAERADIIAYADGSTAANIAKSNYDSWLPSLNLRLGVTEEVNLRFAASKAISRPKFNQLRNFLTQSTATTTSSTEFGGFQISSGTNPYLKPVEAKQYDLTAEWYFSEVGSLTGSLFYKQLDNIILDSGFSQQTYENNGVTQDVLIVGPANTSGKGTVKGYELAYQQTFDFLPGILSGLGMQASYTYIKPSSLPNQPQDGDTTVPYDVEGVQESLPLAQYSEHNVNFTTFYEVDNLSARLAYSWRSEYLLTVQDCCFPFLPVMTDATGQLDGSIFYTVNDNLKIGFQASNILNEVTKTNYVLNAEGGSAPRGYFTNDRRYSITARMKF